MGIPAIDSHGNIFGVVDLGGSFGDGYVWEFSRDKNGSWNEKVLHYFGGTSDDGALPHAGVTIDRHDNIFGTTEDGGGLDCEGFGCGTVYKIDGKTGAISYPLRLDGTGMKFPFAPVLIGAKGHLFTTFVSGGADAAPGCQDIIPGCGGVLEISP